MSSELKRGFIRIASNYMQMGGAVVFGLLLVPLILRGMGPQALGLIGLLGSTIGVAHILEEVMRRAMVQELAEAHHGGDRGRFLEIYNSALLVALVAALVTVVLFGLIIVFLPFLLIIDSPELLAAARWFLVVKAGQMFLMGAAAPTFNMYMVTERFVPYNLILLLMGTGNPLAAGWTVLQQDLPVEQAVVAFAIISSTLTTVVYVVASVAVATQDSRLWPRLSRVTRAGTRQVLSISSWNAVVTTASNLHLRLDMFIMNWTMGGLIGNAMFDPAFRLTSHARQPVLGITRGTQAVAARLTFGASAGPLRDFVLGTTRLHGVVAFPALALLLVLPEPMIELWISRWTELPADFASAVVMLVRILAIGGTLRAISDGWLNMLYGAGQIRRYAPWVLLGGIGNPIVAALLLWMLPDSSRFTGPAWAYVVTLGLGNMVLAPLLTFPRIGMTYHQALGSLMRPLATTLVSSLVLIVFHQRVVDWTLVKLLQAVVTFSAVYGILTLFFVMTPDERVRFRQVLLTCWSGRQPRRNQ